MLINKQTAQNLTWSKEVDGFTVMDREIVDHRRWSIDYYLTVEKDGKFYQHSYSVGATESQDESAFEYEDDEIEFYEVFPSTIPVYRKLE